MGRPKKTIPPVRFGCCLPKDIHDRMERHLHSAVEERIPHGAKSEFIAQLIRGFFERLDGEVKEVEGSLQ